MWHATVLRKNRDLMRGKRITQEDKRYPLATHLFEDGVDLHCAVRDASEATVSSIAKIKLDRNVDYAEWLKFIRECRRRKKKLPNGANYKWLEKQRQERKRLSRPPVVRSHKDLLALQQARRMGAATPQQEIPTVPVAKMLAEETSFPERRKSVATVDAELMQKQSIEENRPQVSTPSVTSATAEKSEPK